MRLPAKRELAVGVLAVLLLWPLAHRALVAEFGMNPWRFFGFAMYCVPKPRIALEVYDLAGDPTRRIRLRHQGMAHRQALVFGLMRNAWGVRHEPDDFARHVLDERPEIESLRVVVVERHLERATARVRHDRHTYDYERLRELPRNRVSATSPP